MNAAIQPDHGVVETAHKVPQDVNPRPKLGAPAESCEVPIGGNACLVCQALELFDESGFEDARFSGNESDATGTISRARERSCQLL